MNVKMNGKLALLLCQCLILFASVLFWLLNRGNAFYKTFTLDEFEVADSAIVAQDVTIEETTSQGEVFLKTPKLSLESGIYLVKISYNANQRGSVIYVESDNMSEEQLYCAEVVLNPKLHYMETTLELTEDADDVTFCAQFSGNGYLSITDISIFETSAVYKKNMFDSILLCVILAMIYIFIHSDGKTKGVILALAVIWGISCIPLLSSYIIEGDDLDFHLLRIEGIREGLSNNVFPVKIHPVQSLGYGYAVGVFYGDIALYFPALLRLLGFFVQDAYKFFIAVINLGTVLIAYFSFRRMFESRTLGIWGSMFCTLNLYRMIDVYQRASVGEVLGLMMFPLVFLSFYLIFMEKGGKNWWKISLLMALSMTGLIQSHILSCEIAFFLILIICIIFIKKVFQRETFRTLIVAVILSVLFNIGFLVPFLDFYNEDILIGSSQWTGCTSLQDMALDFKQIFTLIEKDGVSFWGRYLDAPLGAGIVYGVGILLSIALFICCYKSCRCDKNFRPAILSLILGCCLLIMASKLFPWEAIANTEGIVNMLFSNLQFPWRLLGPASIFLSFVFCYAISLLKKSNSQCAGKLVMIGFVALLLLDCTGFIWGMNQSGIQRYIYDTKEIHIEELGTNEYLPTDTNPDEIKESKYLLSGIVSLEGYTKQGTEIQCQIVSGEQGGYVDFPLHHYRYYACTDMLGQNLPISSGHNGMVRVAFPENYTGTVLIDFYEPWHWRLAELVSLVSGLGCLFVWFRREFIYECN